MAESLRSAGSHEAAPDERNDEIVVYVNGEWWPRDEASISVYDSAFLVGDGIWEGIRIRNGVFAHLDRHLDRLFASAAGVGMEIGMSRTEVTDLLHEVAARNEMTDDAHVRLMITRGTKRSAFQDPRLVVGGPNVVIIPEHRAREAVATSPGISLHTATVRRPPPDSLDQRWNCHSKVHEVVALIQALDAGADEALMLDPRGFVATCNSTNFFIVRDDEIWTSSGEYCLNGITRGLVLELARDVGRTAREKDFTITEVLGASEAFVTGTVGALTPVATIDGHPIGSEVPGPVTVELDRLLAEAIDSATRAATRATMREEAGAGPSSGSSPQDPDP